jgi:hypothetical protein
MATFNEKILFLQTKREKAPLMATFLNIYSKEELASYNELYEQSIANLPYTLSFPIEKAISAMEHHQYGKAMNHMLDFFEVSTSFVSFVFLRLLQQESSKNQQIQSTLEAYVNKIDTKRPLSLGDWLNDLLTPLLLAAMKHLPKDPLTQSFQNTIIEKRKNILLGDKNSPSIVQIRNEYRGHSTTLSEDIYREVVTELEPRFIKLLEALQPLTQCRYDINQEKYVIQMGAADEEGNRSIDLYPLVFANEKDYRYVFHTLKDEQACYVSSNENAVTLVTHEMNELIDKELQRIVPSFDIAKDLNWKEIKHLMQVESSRYLDRVYVEKKYNRELFVEREKLTQALHTFWDSDKTLFPLTGEAGQGKTNQLCYWTEGLIADDKPVLIFNSSDFADCTLDNRLKMVFGYSHRKDIIRLLDSIHAKAVKENETVYIFFDALNECLKYAEEGLCEGPLALYEAIHRLFCSSHYTHFKTLLTCRVYTWKNVILPATEDDEAMLFSTEEEGGQVRGFDREETERAYGIYQQLYQMHTPYEDLDRRVTLRLKDPLILKFTSANYLGNELPTNPERYTSLSLFSHMMDSIGNSYAGNRQREILERLSDFMLKEYMNGLPVDGIAVDELKAAFQDPTSEHYALAQLIYKKDGISIAYAELLNKADRPILKEVRRADHQGEHLYIQFVYERFLEFLLGNALIRTGHKTNSDEHPLPASFFAGIMERVNPNVVFLGAIRNALLQDCMAKDDFTTLIDLEYQWGEEYKVMTLVTETINTMIRENYENALFALIPKLLESKEHEQELIESFNEVVRVIQSNQADEQIITEHKRLSKELAATIRLKKMASVSTVNGILLTDYFNERLYRHDAFSLLWKVMLDPIYDIRNDACMYTYYLSNRKYTLDYTPLNENMTVRIVKEMFGNIKKRGLLRNFAIKSHRSNAMMYVETASRLCVLMIIDHSRNESTQSKRIVSDMLDELRSIFRYLTGNLYFVRLFMPIFQIAMKRQITFQSDYVNNAIEYQTFWDANTFKGNDFQGVSWQQPDVNVLMSFAHHYHRFGHLNDSPDCLSEEQRFATLHKKVLSAYKTGDSFSHFVLERMLVIMGTSRWENIAPIVETFFTNEFRQAPWFDYCQMSMLYILYQVAYYTPEMNHRLLDIYAAEAADWTFRNKGLFRGRRSEKANAIGMYKRNVMCWYAVVYCSHTGDDIPMKGDKRAVPKFYDLIDQAIQTNDKELLYHLVENISELITDMGYVKTALQLLKHILLQFDTQEKVDRIDAITLSRGGIYQYDLVKLVGNVLSTAKNYYAQQIDTFIQKEIIGLDFPGASTYREDILNYHPSGENLSDLLTHRFGNFLMWGLLNVEAADDFAIEAIAASTKTRDSFGWYEQGVKIFIKHFFGVKI